MSDGTKSEVSSAPQASPEQPLIVTESALATVLDIRAAEDDPAQTALKVEITGSKMVSLAKAEFTYELGLVAIADKADDDVLYYQGGHDELAVLVPAASVTHMVGATLDVPANAASGGLVIRNPNEPETVDPLEGLELDVDGDLASKVTAVLDKAVNPALASHGGYATLVGVDDSTVYVTMGGGCQGCAASAMTLRDGIRTMIIDALPEVTEVIDATDHSAGENPFYTEAPA